MFCRQSLAGRASSLDSLSRLVYNNTIPIDNDYLRGRKLPLLAIVMFRFCQCSAFVLMFCLRYIYVPVMFQPCSVSVLLMLRLCSDHVPSWVCLVFDIFRFWYVPSSASFVFGIFHLRCVLSLVCSVLFQPCSISVLFMLRLSSDHIPSWICFVFGMFHLCYLLSSLCIFRLWYVPSLVCPVFGMSRLWYVPSWICSVFVMFRLSSVFGMFRPWYVLSSVCFLFGMDCLRYILSYVSS